MKVTSVLRAVVIAGLLLGLTGCGKSGSADAVPFEPVAGRLVNAGKISATCPDGWYNISVRDYFAGTEDAIADDRLFFQKFTDDEWSNMPNVRISFYGEGSSYYPYEEQLGYYDGAVLLKPFAIGDTIWEGIQYSIGTLAVEVLMSPQGNGVVEVGIRIMGEGERINLTDADVQTILASIAY